MLFYLAFRAFAFLVRSLPQRWGQALARWLGRMVYRVSPLAVAQRDNARHVLGPDATPDQVALTARGAFEERTVNYYEMFSLSGRNLDHMDWRSKIQGWEHLDRLSAEKQGAVVVAAHLGPMEYMIQGVSTLPYEMMGIQEQLKNERIAEYVTELRSAHGMEVISTEDPLLGVYRRLKRGALLFSAVDRDTTGTGLIADFFGAPAWVPDGYARLALRAGVPVIFGYPWRTPGGAEGWISGPIYPDSSLPKDAAVRDIVNRTLRLLEQAISAHPWEWHLSTPIWQVAQEKADTGAPQ